MIEGFKCKQCGVCCKYLDDAFCLTAYKEDIARWEADSDLDILKRLFPIYIGNNQYIHDIWFHPVKQNIYSYCPWLRRAKNNKYKYHCKIHGTKPSHCKNYPIDREQALSLGCSGVKPKTSKEKELRRLGLANLTIPNLKYKGFSAIVDYNKNTGVFKVKIFYINNVNLEEYRYIDKNAKMTFQKTSPENLEKEFHILVNNYLKKKNK